MNDSMELMSHFKYNLKELFDNTPCFPAPLISYDPDYKAWEKITTAICSRKDVTFNRFLNKLNER